MQENSKIFTPAGSAPDNKASFTPQLPTISQEERRNSHSFYRDDDTPSWEQWKQMHDNGGRPPLLSDILTDQAQPVKIPITPDAARRFFLKKFILYGVGFGTAYGAGVGFPFFFIGALFGAPIGAVLGLILGILDGIAMGYLASSLVRKGFSVLSAARTIWGLAPVITMIGGICLTAISGLYIVGAPLTSFDWFILAVDGVATFATWHAAWLAARKFTEEYE